MDQSGQKTFYASQRVNVHVWKGPKLLSTLSCNAEDGLLQINFQGNAPKLEYGVS